MAMATAQGTARERALVVKLDFERGRSAVSRKQPGERE
jgi:hypothetical protein